MNRTGRGGVEGWHGRYGGIISDSGRGVIW